MPDRAFDFERDEIHRDRDGRKEHADHHDARAIAKPHGVDGPEAEPAFRGEHLADEIAENAEREDYPETRDEFRQDGRTHDVERDARAA